MHDLPRRFGLTVGPLQYWWPRRQMLAFYAEVAEQPGGRHRGAGRGGLLAPQRDSRPRTGWRWRATWPAPASPWCWPRCRSIEHRGRTAHRCAGCANRTSSRSRPATPRRSPCWRGCTRRGPRAGLRHRPARQHLQPRGAGRHARPLGAGAWVPPLELSLDAMAHINPPDDPVHGAAGPVRDRGLWLRPHAAGVLGALLHGAPPPAEEGRLRLPRAATTPTACCCATSDGERRSWCSTASRPSRRRCSACSAPAPALARRPACSRLRLSPCSRGFDSGARRLRCRAQRRRSGRRGSGAAGCRAGLPGTPGRRRSPGSRPGMAAVAA